MKRWFAPLAAAVAVLVLLGAGWWFADPGSSGPSNSLAGDSAPADDPPSAGGGSDGSPGSSVPGSRGSVDPGTEPGGEPPPVRPLPTHTNPMGVVIDSYHKHDAGSLTLNYTIGVPECYGKIGEPVVEESMRSVTVTLTRVPPKRDDNVACIEIALLKSVKIELSSPLGDRQVRDGSFGGAVVKTGPSAGGGKQAY